jgi:sulfite reductase (NADPH) hemoprotein beta-component
LIRIIRYLGRLDKPMPIPDAQPGRTRPSFAQASDIDLFLATLEKFERGEINAEQWRAFRLLHGTYGQRQPGDLSMLRVKIPQGILLAPQLEALADVAVRFSRGFGHITTRQNVQLHFVRLHDVEPAMRALADAGITTQEACGNSVRNITGCPLAGVSRDEVFDPTPYAEAMTRHFLRHPLSSSLPRKFKIAFEGCAEDHALTAIHDIGLRAQVRPGDDGVVRGFRVSVGGGTATLPTSARVLVEFLPAGELLAVAEAIVRVFHRRGDRKRRQANRMKFLIRQLGWETFRAEVEAELATIRAAGIPPLPFPAEAPPVEEAPTWPRPPAPPLDAVAARARATPLRGPGVMPVVKADPADDAAFEAWRATNVRPQRQPGYASAAVTLTLGDVTADQLRIVADLSRAYADGAVRVTQAQDLVLRWVPEGELRPLFDRLAAAGLGKDGADTVADVVSCPGAESCRLAVTASRGLGHLLEQHLRARPELVAAARDLQIKVSGCPNGCSQHHVAGIGLQGSARKVEGRAVPQYFVLLGGGVDDGGARFGRLAAKIPARRIPEALERLIALYGARRKDGESATAFFARVAVEDAKAALAGLGELTAETARPEDFVDPGEDHEFKPESMEGECAA